MKIGNCRPAALALLSTVLVTGCATRAPAPTGSVVQETSAEVLAYEALRDDPAADVEQLRDAYVKTPYYQPYGGNVRDALGEIIRLAREGDFKGCLDAVHRVEDEAYPLLNVHHHGWSCALELGDEVDAARHERIARSLFHAITAPGDGRTKDTAWRTLSTRELYLVLAIQGLTPKGQALVQADGRAFDVMTVVPEGGENEEVRYFDITRQMAYGMKFLDEASD